MASSTEFAIGDWAFYIIVQKSSVSLQQKFLGGDGEVLKDENGEWPKLMQKK